MAASMPDENCESQEIKDDNNSSDADLEEDWTIDSDTGDPLADADTLSVFCRSCLSLYEGEDIKDGNFILRCTNCDHRDVIPMTDLQGTVYEQEPQLLVGDLLYNRFQRILKAKEKLKDVDVQNPDYVDDQYRKYFHLHSKLFEQMNTTINDMNNVIDECRKEHNEKMIESIVDKRAKQLEEGACDVEEKIEVVGNKENGTLIISPDDFTVSDSVKIKCFRIGKVGVRESDKTILENGIPDKTVESMPLFKERLNLYKANMEKAEIGNDTNNSSEYSMRVKRRNRKKFRRENSDIHKTEIDRPKSVSNETPDMFQGNNNDISETKSKKKCKKKKSKSSGQQTEEKEPTQVKKRFPRLSTEDYLENIPLQKPIPLAPEEKKYFDEQYNLSKYVLQDIDEVADLNDFIVGKTNEAFKEIVRALLKLREDTLEERKQETIKYIESTVASMTGQVDVVRKEIIEELKNAYKSKMVRSLRQKKELQQTKQQMEECGKILQSYQDMGIYDDRLDDILDRIRKICREN